MQDCKVASIIEIASCTRINEMDVSSNTEVVILSPKDVTSKSKDVKLNGSRAVQMLLSRLVYFCFWKYECERVGEDL